MARHPAVPRAGWSSSSSCPPLIVFAFAFKPADPFGGVGRGLDARRPCAGLARPAVPGDRLAHGLAEPAHHRALPAARHARGYAIARAEPARWRARLMLLVIVPFWTSFLIRIFAWKVLLHPEGALKHALVRLGLVPADRRRCSTRRAPCCWSWSTPFLPFAILPIYAAAEKFDFRLLEAARDLGAGRLRAFVASSCPASGAGCCTAFLVVFIPALGSYVIPDLVGGPDERDARQQDRAARLRRPQPAARERALGAPDPGRARCRWPRSLALQAQKRARRPSSRRTRESAAASRWRSPGCVLAFFYLPIAVLVVNSFNGVALRRRLGGASPSTGTAGCSRTARSGRRSVNSLLIAVARHRSSRSCSAPPAAFALHRYRSRLQRAALRARSTRRWSCPRS